MLTALYGTAIGADRDQIDRGEARNGAIHVLSLILTKAADGVLSPKLVLSSVLNALGAPSAFIGTLVPIREAGALVPQLAMAAKIEAASTRRFFWAAGSALQGLAALAIALAIWKLDGSAAGWAVVGALAVFSLARALCSVTYKDALARTIPKTRRGAISGVAGSVAAALVLGFGALLATGILPARPQVLACAVALAGTAWIVAGLIFTRLDEREVEARTDGDLLTRLTRPLFDDPQFRRFVLARALLTGTALAPPFLLLASASASGDALAGLGPFMLASAAASILSSFVWGRLSDRSSRLVLLFSAATATLVLGIAAAMSLTTGGLGGLPGSVAAIFFAQTAYEGVRAGRKLHLTDMATDDNRTRYTALSNTLIGAVLVIGGGLGVLADVAGPGAVLALLAVTSALALIPALGLDEVQRD